MIRLLFALSMLGACARPALEAASPPSGDKGLARLQTVEEVKRALRPSGRPLLVHFWALWCVACVEELPRQVSLARELRQAGVDALFVDADGFDKQAKVLDKLASVGAEGVARQAMLNMELDVNAVTPLVSLKWSGLLPATFAVRVDGKVGAEVLGPLTPDGEREVRAALAVQSLPEGVRSSP